MAGGLEWWHVFVGVIGVGLSAMGLGMKAIGSGFQQWSDRLKEITTKLDHRLGEIEKKFDRHQQTNVELRVEVERRLSYIESRMQRPLDSARRWYDKPSHNED